MARPSPRGAGASGPPPATGGSTGTSPLSGTSSYVTANGMTPSPSDLSIFSHNDEEVGEEDEDENSGGDDEQSDDSSRGPGEQPEPETPEKAIAASAPSRGDRILPCSSSSPNDGALERFRGETLDDAEAAADDDRRLSRELLDALYLGTGNFLLAYNTRAGIGVLMRIFKLLQRRQFRALLDLPVLLDEKHLSFRVDAVSLGLFLGWFTGGYRGLRALLPYLLRRLVRARRAAARLEETATTNAVHDDNSQGHEGVATTALCPMANEAAVEELSSVFAGAIAASALFFVDVKRRRSLALYAFSRALQCAYNTAKKKQYWHFWGSDWKYGDALLFGLSSAQVMYAFIMRPTTLPSEYFRFIQKTGPVELEVLDFVRRANRGLPLDPALVRKFVDKYHIKGFDIGTIANGMAAPAIVPCRLVHHQGETCTKGILQTYRRAFVSAFPLYLSLFIVPSVVIHFKKFLAHPVRTLVRAVLNATRSNSFVASFVALYMAAICAQRKVMVKDHRFTYYMAGLLASVSILIEPKSRRSELALYVMPRALDSLFCILRDRKIFTGIKNGEVLLFSMSMACMMHCYEHEKDSMGSFLHGTLKRFLQTATEKKRIFLTNLEHQNQRKRAAHLPSEVSMQESTTVGPRP